VTIPELVAACQRGKSLPFLIIGGYAVIAYGYARTTFDLDFLVRQSQREEWRRNLESLGYSAFAEHAAFMQFSAPEGGVDLDLMLVNDETFDRMQPEARPICFGPIKSKMVSLDHLIALKLHVMKQGLAHRTIRDMDDMITLALKNGLDIASEHYKQLFLKYGTQEIYEKALHATKRQ
jgi:hypothetical protein